MAHRNGAYVCPLFAVAISGSLFIQPWILDEEPSLEVMKAAWDRGTNTFDTANLYSNGESERLIAKFIQKVTVPTFSSLHPVHYAHLAV